MNVHDSCGTSNKHNTLFDSEIFKGSSVMLVMWQWWNTGSLSTSAFYKMCLSCVPPARSLNHVLYPSTCFHLAISTVSKLRHFPDSLSPAYMYKIYLHFIDKSNSLNESPMEGNTFRFIYVKNFYKCLFNSTQWNQLIK